MKTSVRLARTTTRPDRPIGSGTKSCASGERRKECEAKDELGDETVMNGR